MPASYKLLKDGKEIDFDSFEDELIVGIVENMKSNIEESISDIRCPEHGEFATVDIDVSDYRKLKVSIHGCCDLLTDLAESAIKA